MVATRLKGGSGEGRGTKRPASYREPDDDEFEEEELLPATRSLRSRQGGAERGALAPSKHRATAQPSSQRRDPTTSARGGDRDDAPRYPRRQTRGSQQQQHTRDFADADDERDAKQASGDAADDDAGSLDEQEEQLEQQLPSVRVTRSRLRPTDVIGGRGGGGGGNNGRRGGNDGRGASSEEEEEDDVDVDARHGAGRDEDSDGGGGRRLRSGRRLYSSREAAEEDEVDADEDDVDADDDQLISLRVRPLRQRTQIQRFSPRPEDDVRARQRFKRQRTGNGGARRGGYRGPSRFYDDDDDFLDDPQGINWKLAQGGIMSPMVPFPGALVPSTPLLPGAAALTPGPAAAGPHQPWLQPAAPHEAVPYTGKEKAAGAEITPLQVDPSLGFDQVGGLDKYISALKEMVFLPLVYPELFERFHITPPRGVLFYGPPGTGKTLVARALAAHASRGGKRVAFFMRKGADLLSKWVGEAERQLRLLFEEAQRHQPAIIFFDEIDGLAPVRSSKQDQIHNSIVSTLLALMDGLDARGKVVVIGATNRVDALDGALRRPGRFDRELLFPLPNLQARRSILDIHTAKWAEQPTVALKEELSQLCVGYCGADLKALCTEAALRALRRRYPQIYDSEDKLVIQPEQVHVAREDFMAAFSSITPASHRAAATHARPLPPAVAPCLADTLSDSLARLIRIFPPAEICLSGAAGGEPSPPIAATADAHGQAQIGGAAASTSTGGAVTTAAARPPALPATGLQLSSGLAVPLVQLQRPRLLLCGAQGAGQGHVAPALLYALDGLPIHAIGLPSLMQDPGARSLEEALVHALIEARRSAPAVLFLPHVQLWWQTAPASLRATLWMLLEDLPSDLPLLLLATADLPAEQLDEEVWQMFKPSCIVELGAPSSAQRQAFFSPVMMAAAQPPPPPPAAAPADAGMRSAGAGPPPLQVSPEAAQAAEEEERLRRDLAARERYEQDQAVLRALRMGLRAITTSLLSERRFQEFHCPRAADDPSDWYQVVSQPMDLLTVLSRVDTRHYVTTAAYLSDIELIVQCAREYYGEELPWHSQLSRAHELADRAQAMVQERIGPQLADRCDKLAATGTAPPPPGMLLPIIASPLPEKYGAAAAARAAAAATAVKRQSARLRPDPAAPLADRPHLPDPEVLVRHQRQVSKHKRPTTSDADDVTAGGGGSSALIIDDGAAAEAPAAVGPPNGIGGLNVLLVGTMESQTDEAPPPPSGATGAGAAASTTTPRPPAAAAADANADPRVAPSTSAAAAAAAAPGADRAVARGASLGPPCSPRPSTNGQQTHATTELLQQPSHREDRGKAAAAAPPVGEVALGDASAASMRGTGPGGCGAVAASAAASGAGAAEPSARLVSPEAADNGAINTSLEQREQQQQQEQRQQQQQQQQQEQRQQQAPEPAHVQRASALLQRVVNNTSGMLLSQLEGVHARLSMVVAHGYLEPNRDRVLADLEQVLADLQQASAEEL